MMTNQKITLVVFQQWIGVPFVCGMLGLSACSAARPPTETMAKAELAVHEASESEVTQYASSEFRLAQEKFSRAQVAMNAENYEEARRLAEQALVDAQLAEARAESRSAQQTAQELRKAIEALRTEATRASATD